MIRLPSNHAAITAPLVVSSTHFPGIPVGRSLLDGRAFHLSPVLTETALLPSTNSLALGGLGSGKSTTAKARIRREILRHDHQAVVIDSFGEDNTGEWAPLVRSLEGRVIEAGAFTLNPCSGLFPPEVREQLIRSLILAVEPGALTPQAAHALQHALNHPKSTSLNGLVDALARPEDGRWPAAKLTDWGEGAAIALSRYTEGSLRGIFDGQDAALPPTDLPIISFDFTGLDRNSPAIPSLMAAVSCWAEHVWLRQSTAVHRHLVVEEAWQILLSPATSELIQRLLKNSRKAALSLEAIMHTLSDLGDGKAQDLARLCEIAHVGRLGPEEAAAVGILLGLPRWAVDAIPTLGPGQAVWKVGPDYVDIIQTVLTEDEMELTDTSARRRQAQQPQVEHAPATEDNETTDGDDQDAAASTLFEQPAHDVGEESDRDWDWDMPPNVIDRRHQDVLQAAREGRCSEAADLAAIGEREDITAHGINSAPAASWLTTQSQVADLCGNPDQAVHLRATVARMGNDTPPPTTWHPESKSPTPTSDGAPAPTTRRRIWPTVATVAALSLATVLVWDHPEADQQTQDREAKAAAYKGRSGAALVIDDVSVDIVAHWTNNRVILELRSNFDADAQYLRLDAAGKTASTVREDGYLPLTPEIALPVNDPLADVTVRVAIGGKTWKENTRAPSREIRLSPTGIAFDAKTGKQLPSDL
jgi:hypothetical protein